MCLLYYTLKVPSDWKMTMLLLCKSRIQINDVQAITSDSNTFMKSSFKPATVVKNVKQTGKAKTNR